MDQFLRPASRTGFLEIWLPPCLSLFLPLPPSPFQAEFPSGARRLTKYTYLHYSNRCQWPNVDGANLLSQGFISSPHKPSYSASFLQ